MIRYICPQCQHDNPMENQFCGQCGEPLAPKALATRQPTGLTIGGTHLPAPTLKRVGQAALVSLAGLAVEAGLIWLRRRVTQMEESAVGPAKAPSKKETAVVPVQPATREVTIFSQRIVSLWERGRLVEQIIERSVWQRRE